MGKVNNMGNIFVSKVTAAGQISIPKELRESMDLNEAERVTIEPMGDALLVKRIKPYREEILKDLRAFAKAKGITRKDVEKAVRKVGKELYEEKYGT
jgi:AbrB family looped-hinge helix DNA binding protein